jgi:hypothetical protein
MEPSPAALARLREITMAFAARHGDPHPTHLRMVETTSTALDAVWGVRHPNNPPPIPIYVVIANGQFISGGPPRPHGHAAPRGTRLFMQLRRSDFDLIDWGLDLDRELHTLGTFTEL